MSPNQVRIFHLTMTTPIDTGLISSVMIVSYETLRTMTNELANCEVGLLLCDEGHRLKNSGDAVLDPSKLDHL